MQQGQKKLGYSLTAIASEVTGEDLMWVDVQCFVDGFAPEERLHRFTNGYEQDFVHMKVDASCGKIELTLMPNTEHEQIIYKGKIADFPEAIVH